MDTTPCCGHVSRWVSLLATRLAGLVCDQDERTYERVGRARLEPHLGGRRVRRGDPGSSGCGCFRPDTDIRIFLLFIIVIFSIFLLFIIVRFDIFLLAISLFTSIGTRIVAATKYCASHVAQTERVGGGCVALRWCYAVCCVRARVYASTSSDLCALWRGLQATDVGHVQRMSAGWLLRRKVPACTLGWPKRSSLRVQQVDDTHDVTSEAHGVASARVRGTRDDIQVRAIRGRSQHVHARTRRNVTFVS